MAHEETPASTTVVTPGRGRRALYTAALAGGLVLGGFGIAAAQTDTTSPPTTVAPDGDTNEFGPMFGEGGRHARGRHGGLEMGAMGARGALHGEFVTNDPDGEGYRTVVVQRGTVTAVSGDALTVKSEDDFTETYAVTDNTVVNAGDQGIGDVKEGDEVHVRAVAGSGDPEAVHVVNATSLRDIHEHWHPGAGAGGAA